MIEINGNPNRRDLNERHARLAAEAGVKIVVNTDAHGDDTLSNMQYGLATARRAWLTKAEIANTADLARAPEAARASLTSARAGSAVRARRGPFSRACN